MDSQLEERIGYLEHEDVRMTVVMDDEDTLDCSPHPKVLIVVFQSL